MSYATNQMAKARRLADILEGVESVESAAMVADLDDEVWDLICVVDAERTGKEFRPASAETRELTVLVLEDRERARAGSPDDPFDGLVDAF